MDCHQRPHVPLVTAFPTTVDTLLQWTPPPHLSNRANHQGLVPTPPPHPSPPPPKKKQNKERRNEHQERPETMTDRSGECCAYRRAHCT